MCDKPVDDWRQHRSYWPPDNPSWTFVATCHSKTEKIVVYDSDLEGQDFFLLADAFSSEVEAIARRE